MKCKVCGHRTTTLSAMRKHYWKKHEATMKRRISEGRKGRQFKRAEKYVKTGKFCPWCGKAI